MLNPLRKIARWHKPKADDLNTIIDAVNRLANISVRGPGVRTVQGPMGTQVTIRPAGGGGGAAGTSLYVARVMGHDSRGGGYYNCYLQSVYAGENWDKDDEDIFITATGTLVIVLNLAERASSVHDLTGGDFLVCWPMTDQATENNAGEIYVGIEVFGRHTFGEW